MRKRKTGSKWRNRPVIYDGIVFGSELERDEYIALCFLVNEGKIKAVECQFRVNLIPAKKTKYGSLRGVDFIPDFRITLNDGSFVFYDTKSDATRKITAYILKRKLFFHVHDIWLFDRWDKLMKAIK